MYLLDNWFKFAAVMLLVAGYGIGWSVYLNANRVAKAEQATTQLTDNGQTGQEMRRQLVVENNAYAVGWMMVGVAILLVFVGDLRRMLKAAAVGSLLAMLLGGTTGCTRKPFEPIKLEVIKSNEEAFLLPLVGDTKKQTASNNEEYLKANLVYSKQVQLPQQWVELGYARVGWNGEWRDAATLIKVDKSPVTREWTADSTSGTSAKNEAVWVMTSDQVEFSTGWTITARIENRDDAVRFLHNYPNGALTNVLDTEARSKLQAVFGLEVTDLPMDELRKTATPHINKTVKTMTDFFKDRGVTITNLGITGGFVYKDKTILDTMVRVFNAEQEKSVAAAETNAQLERNKKVILDATGKADAVLKTKKAEADGIKLVADARLYELEKAAQQLTAYVQLKQLELQRELLAKWDGAYPRYFMGTGGANPNMLLQLPALEEKK